MTDTNKIQKADNVNEFATLSGQSDIGIALQEKLKSDPELCRQIGQIFFQFSNTVGGSSTLTSEERDNILGFFATCKKLSQMPEEKARSICKKVLQEELNVSPEKVDDILQNVNFKKPESFLIATPNVIKKLYNNEMMPNTKTIKVNVGPKNMKNKEYVVPVRLMFIPSSVVNGIELNDCLTPFDKQVLFGIMTLIDNGYTTFTAKQVYETFAGKTTTNNETIARVNRSITKQKATLINIDWTKHAEMNGLPINGNISPHSKKKRDYIAIEENLLLLRKTKFRCNGQELEGYTVLREPLLYRYAKQVGQISSVDRDLLNTPVSNTETNIVLKNELIERIETMKKRGNKISSNITFESLYKIANVKNNKVDRKRIRDTICKILDNWMIKEYINNYKLNKEKGQYLSISIEI